MMKNYSFFIKKEDFNKKNRILIYERGLDRRKL